MQCLGVPSHVYTFEADDADQDKIHNGRVYYELQAADNPEDLKHFQLNPDSGELTSKPNRTVRHFSVNSSVLRGNVTSVEKRLLRACQYVTTEEYTIDL